MSSGSGIFTSAHALKAHLMQGTGGLAAEVADVRNDVAAALAPMAAMTVQEFTNPAAADAAGLEAATATTVSPRTVTAFVAGGTAALTAFGRNVTFTTAGGTPADAPASAVITGEDIDGNAQTETVVLAQTATIASGVKIFKGPLTSVAYAAADGTGATVSIGFGPLLGLEKTPKTRAGLAAPIREIAVGALVTTGVFSATNRSYAPASAPNGTNDYCVFFEYVPA